jgi:hypothetical protein
LLALFFLNGSAMIGSEEPMTHFNKFVEFLAILGGTRRDALDRAQYGAAQAAASGGILLITATIAAFTGGYAVHQVFLGSSVWIAAVGGTLWASFVFCVDRAFILGIDKSADPRRLALQVLVRVPMAIVVALVISAPLLLKVCEGPIRLELRKERQELWLKEIASVKDATGLPEVRKIISELKTTRDAQRERLLREPESYQYRQAVEKLRAAEGRLRSLTAALQPRINRARTELERLLAGPEPPNAQADALRRQIAEWQGELSRAAKDVSQARQAVEQAATEWHTQIAAAVESADRELARLEPLERRAADRVAQSGADAEKEFAELLRGDLINQYKALRRITNTPNHPDRAAIRAVEFALHVFFMILELTPVMIKALSRRNSLDVAMEAVEFLDAEKINVEANLRVLRLRQAASVEAEALKKWSQFIINDIQKQPAMTTAELRDILQEVEQVAG